MNYFRTVCVALVGLSLAGCNMLQSKEEECLQSGRLEMKDPDSLKVVQNLGGRGQASLEGVGGFWLRYSATNSYGARVSSNMACEKLENKWVRSVRMEQSALEEIRTKSNAAIFASEMDKLRQKTADLKACKTRQCFMEVASEARASSVSPERLIEKVEKEADTAATTAVYGEIGPL